MSGKKKGAQRFSFGSGDRRWGGGLPRKGVVAEKFVPSFESLSSLGFKERNLGHPKNFAGMSLTPGGVQKVCAKKFVLIFRSLLYVVSFFSQKTTSPMTPNYFQRKKRRKNFHLDYTRECLGNEVCNHKWPNGTCQLLSLFGRKGEARIAIPAAIYRSAQGPGVLF